MAEVYFDNIHLEIIRLINSAQKSLKICVAWFTDYDIYRSLLLAQKKGVQISIMVANHEFNNTSRVDFKELLRENCYVGYIGNLNAGRADRFMHNKFCVIDDQIVVSGSFNWTRKARLNDENIIVIKNDPNIVAKFNAKFENIKPKYGFALEGNNVQLLPIEQIAAKWNKIPSGIPKNKSKNSSQLQAIFDKF